MLSSMHPTNNISPEKGAPAKIEQSSNNGSGEALSYFAQHQISIAGINKALLLKCLWDNANGAGKYFKAFPFLQLTMSLLDNMDIKVAEQHIQRSLSTKKPLDFDYVENKPIKSDIRSEFIYSKPYDDHHGDGSCLRAIQRAIAMATESDPGERSDQSLNDPQQVEELSKEQNLELAENDSGGAYDTRL